MKKIYFVKFEGGRIIMSKDEIDHLEENGVPVKILRKATERERLNLKK